ncbi:MAG: hypothetical protein J6M53_08150 [Bacteroidaceae bacterium]|nr:hypothetical protein [Bacteroidaceae bacterium]
MTHETEEFVSALTSYVRATLPPGDEADYCREAVQIVDARNHLFRSAGQRATDEEHDIYALRSLCRLDEDTLLFVPDEGRIRSLARTYFA